MAPKAREAGKELLLLNLDETSIPVTFTHAGGNVMLLDPTKNWHQPPRQPATRAEKRAYFTHVGLVCNDPAIQPQLPQVLFVGDKLLTLAALAAIQPHLPDNVYVKRLKKGWNNHEEHVIIVRLLGLILEPLFERYQPVLMFDASPLHIHDDVMAELAARSIWYIVIPARLTWLLQPLDTHGFAKYKRYLKQRFQDTIVSSAGVNLTERMVRLVVETIRAVLQGNRWDGAFRSNGLDGDQTHVSNYIKETLQFETLPPYPPTPPSVDALRLCWPRNRAAHPAVVFQPLPPAELAVEMLALPDLLPAILPPDPVADALALLEHPPALPPPSHPAASSSSPAASAPSDLHGIAAVPPAEPPADTPRLRLRQKSSASVG